MSRAAYVFFGFMLAVLFLLAGVVIANSEAQVLAVGSTYTLADGTVVTVTDQRFVLDRNDMNAATEALKDRPVDAATILQLQTLSDGQQKTIDADGKWKTAISIVSFFLGVVVDEAVRK
jgi:chromosome segregation ATPase